MIKYYLHSHKAENNKEDPFTVDSSGQIYSLKDD